MSDYRLIWGNMKRWGFVLLGLGLGLYLSRVIAETTMTTWSWPTSLALVVVCSIIGVGLATLGQRFGLTLTPLAILYALSLPLPGLWPLWP